MAEAVTTQAGVAFGVLEKSLTSEFRQHFPSYVDGVVRGDPGGFVLTSKYARHADDIYRFQLRSDDVWVVTFPKCGNIPAPAVFCARPRLNRNQINV